MPRFVSPNGKGPNSDVMRRHLVPENSPYGRFLAGARKELADQLGEPLTAAQRVLVDRCAWLQLYTSLFDEKTSNTGQMSEHDRKSYLAFSNSLTRALRLLGIVGSPKRPAGRPKTVYQPGALTDILAEAQFNEAAE